MVQQAKKDSQNGGLCPACNRYIGSISTCPYCDVEIPKPPLIRGLHTVAVLLATVGLFLLYITAINHNPQLVEVADITPAMNFAHVRMNGIVQRKPYISRNKDYLSFRIHDPSGEIKIIARHKTAEILIGTKKLPAKGERVEARGNLHASAHDAYLEIQLPEHLTIKQQKQTTDEP